MSNINFPNTKDDLQDYLDLVANLDGNQALSDSELQIFINMLYIPEHVDEDNLAQDILAAYNNDIDAVTGVAQEQFTISEAEHSYLISVFDTPPNNDLPTPDTNNFEPIVDDDDIDVEGSDTDTDTDTDTIGNPTEKSLMAVSSMSPGTIPTTKGRLETDLDYFTDKIAKLTISEADQYLKFLGIEPKSNNDPDYLTLRTALIDEYNNNYQISATEFSAISVLFDPYRENEMQFPFKKIGNNYIYTGEHNLPTVAEMNLLYEQEVIDDDESVNLSIDDVEYEASKDDTRYLFIGERNSYYQGSLNARDLDYVGRDNNNEKTLYRIDFNNNTQTIAVIRIGDDWYYAQNNNIIKLNTTDPNNIDIQERINEALQEDAPNRERVGNTQFSYDSDNEKYYYNGPKGSISNKAELDALFDEGNIADNEEIQIIFDGKEYRVFKDGDVYILDGEGESQSYVSDQVYTPNLPALNQNNNERDTLFRVTYESDFTDNPISVSAVINLAGPGEQDNWHVVVGNELVKLDRTASSRHAEILDAINTATDNEFSWPASASALQNALHQAARNRGLSEREADRFLDGIQLPFGVNYEEFRELLRNAYNGTIDIATGASSSRKTISDAEYEYLSSIVNGGPDENKRPATGIPETAAELNDGLAMFIDESDSPNEISAGISAYLSSIGIEKNQENEDDYDALYISILLFYLNDKAISSEEFEDISPLFEPFINDNDGTIGEFHYDSDDDIYRYQGENRPVPSVAELDALDLEEDFAISVDFIEYDVTKSDDIYILKSEYGTFFRGPLDVTDLEPFPSQNNAEEGVFYRMSFNDGENQESIILLDGAWHIAFRGQLVKLNPNVPQHASLLEQIMESGAQPDLVRIGNTNFFRNEDDDEGSYVYLGSSQPVPRVSEMEALYDELGSDTEDVKIQVGSDNYMIYPQNDDYIYIGIDGTTNSYYRGNLRTPDLDTLRDAHDSNNITEYTVYEVNYGSHSTAAVMKIGTEWYVLYNGIVVKLVEDTPGHDPILGAIEEIIGGDTEEPKTGGPTRIVNTNFSYDSANETFIYDGSNRPVPSVSEMDALYVLLNPNARDIKIQVDSDNYMIYPQNDDYVYIGIDGTTNSYYRGNLHTPSLDTLQDAHDRNIITEYTVYEVNYGNNLTAAVMKIGAEWYVLYNGDVIKLVEGTLGHDPILGAIEEIISDDTEEPKTDGPTRIGNTNFSYDPNDDKWIYDGNNRPVPSVQELNMLVLTLLGTNISPYRDMRIDDETYRFFTDSNVYVFEGINETKDAYFSGNFDDDLAPLASNYEQDAFYNLDYPSTTLTIINLGGKWYYVLGENQLVELKEDNGTHIPILVAIEEAISSETPSTGDGSTNINIPTASQLSDYNWNLYHNTDWPDWIDRQGATDWLVEEFAISEQEAKKYARIIFDVVFATSDYELVDDEGTYYENTTIDNFIRVLTNIAQYNDPSDQLSLEDIDIAGDQNGRYSFESLAIPSKSDLRLRFNSRMNEDEIKNFLIYDIGFSKSDARKIANNILDGNDRIDIDEFHDLLVIISDEDGDDSGLSKEDFNEYA